MQVGNYACQNCLPAELHNHTASRTYFIIDLKRDPVCEKSGHRNRKNEIRKACDTLGLYGLVQFKFFQIPGVISAHHQQNEQAIYMLY